MRFDRLVPSTLIEALQDEGCAAPLLARRFENPSLCDVQLRTAPGRSWASLYAGLSAVLSVEHSKRGWRLATHATYRKLGGFSPDWAVWQDADHLAGTWPQANAFLDAILDDLTIVSRYLRREGKVHPLMASGRHDDYSVVQREVVVAFADGPTRSSVLEGLAQPIYDAVSATGRTDAWWPGIRDNNIFPNLGGEVDFVGVDDDGRLLVIEVKPHDELAGIVWAPAQVAVYADLFARLTTEQPDLVDVLNGMLDQRVALRLAAPGRRIRPSPPIVPVVAIGAGAMSGRAVERLEAVASAVSTRAAAPDLAPLEVWLLDEKGGIADRWLPSARSRARGIGTTAVRGSFSGLARLAAVAWKEATAALPGTAKAPAPYRGVGAPLPFCLPLELAAHNLLPEARSIALDRFEAAGIPWHHGGARRPSNHLLSSQVQCANALAPFVDRPDALVRMFGDVLPIAEVLPFESTTASPFDRTDCVVFEWIGLADYLGERAGRPTTRGANSTSSDAAIRYRAHSGHVEIALIEWKYTEQYLGHSLDGGEARTAVRRQRYQHLWHDSASPIRTDLVAYEDMFVEPFYQLMRQQFLAGQMEAVNELGAEVVRVVVVRPSNNHELARSFNREGQRIGGLQDVYEVWRRLLRRPDRFGALDSASLLDDRSPCSDEFKARYADLAASTPRTMPATVSADDIEGLRSAAENARVVLQRVAAEGGVLGQLIDLTHVARDDPSAIAETTRRLEELAELARRLRADDLYGLLEH